MGDTVLSRKEVLGYKQKVLSGPWCRAVTAISALGALILCRARALHQKLRECCMGRLEQALALAGTVILESLCRQ